MTNEQQAVKRISFILHKALVDIRLLALSQKCTQVFDLADAIEPFPGYLYDWKAEYFDRVKFNLETYQRKYSEKAFDYVAFLEKFDPPGW